jgi:membrane protein DedA with SNARE-associated domain
VAIDIPGGPDIVLGNLETFVSDWGYLAILIGTFLEGETIVLVGGIAASQGWLEIGWVYAAAVSGSYAGDQAYLVATRLLGRPWVDKRPKLRARIQPVLRLLEKWGDLYVLIYRFIYGVRTVSAVAIGLTPYPIARFAVLNAVAVTIWALAFCAAGYFLGEAARHLVSDVEGLFKLLLAAGAAVLAAYLLYRLVRSRRAAAAGASTGEPVDRTISLPAGLGERGPGAMTARSQRPD